MDILKLLEMSKIPYIGLLAVAFLVTVYIYRIMTSGEIERLFFQAKDKMISKIIAALIIFTGFLAIILLLLFTMSLYVPFLFDCFTRLSGAINTVYSIAISLQLLIAIFFGRCGRQSSPFAFLRKIKDHINNSEGGDKIISVTATANALLASMFVASINADAMTITASNHVLFFIVGATVNTFIITPVFICFIKAILYPQGVLHYIIDEKTMRPWYIIKTVGSNIMLGDCSAENDCSVLKIVHKDVILGKEIHAQAQNKPGSKKSANIL